MLIVPIGHDHGALRRWPVVTFAIMGLCAAAFVAARLTPPVDPEEVQARLTVAVAYYLDHPGLAADPRLRDAVAEAVDAQDPPAQAAIRKRLSAPPDPPSPLDADRQARLDALTEAWLAVARSGQHWRFGLVPAEFSGTRLLTHIFVHADLAHLLFNMLFLYFSGPTIEDAWGRPLFALFYLGAGAFSAAFFTAQYPDLAIPLVGASGAIAGVMGAFFVRFPRAQLRLFYVWMFRVGTTTIPAWVALLVWVAGEFLSARTMDWLAPGSGGAGVAYWAHVSGFAFGAVAAVGVRWLRLEERVEQALEARSAAADPLWRAADRALRDDETDQAWRALRARVLGDPADRDAALAYWDLAHRLDRSREAAPVVLRVVRAELLAAEDEAALAHWDELQERAPDAPVPLDLAVKVAASLHARWRSGEARALVEHALARVDPRTPPAALADLAHVATGIDGTLGAEAVARALAHPGQPAAVRAELERLAGPPTARGASAPPSA